MISAKCPAFSGHWRWSRYKASLGGAALVQNVARQIARAAVRRRYQPMSASGDVNVERVGVSQPITGDVYHRLFEISWVQTIALISLGYLIINLVFAALYLIGDGNIVNARPRSFADAFFFSVQTLASIGYGHLTPGTTYAHVLVTLEALVNVLLMAMATGLVFARFATPRARVLFSDKAVVDLRGEQPVFAFRLANERSNHIVEARINVTLARNVEEPDGSRFRRLIDVPLRRSMTPLFQLGWVVFHDIDEASPLRHDSLPTLLRDEASIIVTLTGVDDTLAEPIHARHAYNADDLIWNAHFADTFRMEDDKRIVDYGRFHDVVRDGDPPLPTDQTALASGEPMSRDL